MKANKGVTPVIASVLLITIAVTSVMAVAQFFSTTQNQAQQSYEQRFNQQQVETQAELDIEHVYKDTRNGNDPTAHMILRNTGEEYPIQVKDSNGEKRLDLFVDGQPIGGYLNDQTGNYPTDWNLIGVPSGEYTLSPGESVTLDTGVGFPGADESIQLRIVGRYGNTAYHTCFSNGASDQTC